MGPFVSDIARVTDAYAQSHYENHGRPFAEAFLPKGIPQLLKSVGMIDMRYNAKTGDKMLKDTTLADHVFSFLGYTPQSVEKMYQLQSALKNMEEKRDADFLSLKRQYVQATTRSEVALIQSEWNKLNAFWSKRGFTMKKAKELETKIEPRLLQSFKRIRKNSRNGLGIVYVQRDACGGCFNKIPPQRQLDIRSRKKIIVCEYCGRIMIDPELAGVTLEHKEEVKEKPTRRRKTAE